MESNLTPIKLESKFDDKDYELMKALHLAHFIEVEKKLEEMKKENEYLKERVYSLNKMVERRCEYWYCHYCDGNFPFVDNNDNCISCNCGVSSCRACVTLGKLIMKECDKCEENCCPDCIGTCDDCKDEFCGDCMSPCQNCNDAFCGNCMEKHTKKHSK